MLPQQRTELIAALDADDDIRAVTIALHICAHLARTNKRMEARIIRDAIDVHQSRVSAEKEHRRKRLEIATAILAGHKYWEDHVAIEAADRLMAENARKPIPDGAIP